jgi:hypothetical protein
MLAALENPAVESEDVKEVAGSLKAGPQVLAAIARRKQWSGDHEVAIALCLNPKTPYFASRFLLVHLSNADLREVSRNALTPPALAKDASQLLDKKKKGK